MNTMQQQRALGVFVMREPVPEWKIMRILENDFTVREQVGMLVDYAGTIQEEPVKCALLVQAGWCALKGPDAQSASAMLARLSECGSVRAKEQQAGLDRVRAALLASLSPKEEQQAS